MQILQLTNQAYGDDHLATASAMISVALDWAALGRYAEAEKFQAKVVQMRRQSLW